MGPKSVRVNEAAAISGVVMTVSIPFLREHSRQQTRPTSEKLARNGLALEKERYS
jgi:hypothetical protein